MTCICPDNPRGVLYAEAVHDPDSVHLAQGRQEWERTVGYDCRVHADCPLHGSEVTA